MTQAKAKSGKTLLDIAAVRADFPILSQRIHGDKPLVYLDNAASAQKPKQVMATMEKVAETGYGNIHRSLHEMARRAETAFEGARARVARFIKAADAREIVFTRNATEGINLVASSFGGMFFEAGDRILLSEAEHHANIVPWQIIAMALDLEILVCPILDDGSLDLEAYQRLLQQENIRMVALNAMSNVTGVINPVKELARMAHEQADAMVLIDACQYAAHAPIDVQDWDCDFLVMTGHKLYGPTGIGVLYAKLPILDAMPPYQGGGDMIESVSWENTRFAAPPRRFEAGTPAILEAIGLAAALDYIENLGWPAITLHEQNLRNYALKELGGIKGLRLFGRHKNKGAIFSFQLGEANGSDVATLADTMGIALRSGHLCAEPLAKRYGVSGFCRASFSLYNTKDEVDALIKALHRIQEML